jgi:hypothetical protein
MYYVVNDLFRKKDVDMKKLLLTIYMIILLAGCGPKIPSMLKSKIQESFNNEITILKVKDNVSVLSDYVPVTNDGWCVAYQVEGENSEIYTYEQVFALRSLEWVEVPTLTNCGGRVWLPGQEKGRKFCTCD